jgi:hypothetical protein
VESHRFLVHNRNPNYARTFDTVVHADNIEVLKPPPQAPKGTLTANESSTPYAAKSSTTS